ncbi:MAG: DUF1934 domain-containing protein [Lachnospiraceae bacterium]|nr:DUF1934 domain-containing protein [Lachnospiraceae bacterium]
MRQSVVVRIKGVTENDSGMEDEVCSEFFGIYYKKDGFCFIKYDEFSEGDGEPAIKNLIKADNEMLSHKRSGTVESDILLKIGEEYRCRYYTAYGMIEMDVKTLYYRFAICEGLPRIRAEYELVLGGEPSGIRKLDIEVHPLIISY